MTARRVIGLETEFGIMEPADLRANPVVLSADFVETYGHAGEGSGTHGPVAWDYTGEDPLNDARGFRMSREEADPSQLTDDPENPAPPAGVVVAPLTEEEAELRRPRAANAVLTNGGRLYVDHAHPEYSSPETSTPREAVLWDRAGELIARRGIELLRERGREFAIYKNNVDGKGAAYGSHENYLVDRSLPFTEIIRYLIPFFVTRPILCGTGRVGLGPRSEQPGFQISQRADYVENDVGLETTFNRPIINTRDEPHAAAQRFRRLHVIGGDANQFDVSILLKVGTTSLVLWMLEQDAVPLGLESVIMDNPVPLTWTVSQDPSLTTKLEVHEGEPRTALEIQQIYLDAVRDALAERGEVDADTAEILERWQGVLDLLSRDIFSAAPQVEWVAKYQILNELRERGGGSWDSDKLRALDVQWHDLRPEHSIVAKLRRAGRVEELFSEAEISRAALHAPGSTRAYLRGQLISRFSEHVAAASWSSAVLRDSAGRLHRLSLPDPAAANEATLGATLAAAHTIDDVIAALTAVGS